MSTTQETKLDKGGEPSEGEKKSSKPPKLVSVVVDDNDVATPKETTPRALMAAAGLDPDSRRLVRVQGKRQEPFENPDEEIKVHEGELFITVATGGTPVS